MKGLKRQDKNGVRHASDIERKYRLGQIDYTAEEIEKLKMQIIVDSSLSTSSVNPVQNKVVTKALNSKINKEEGKELSSNDFSDTLLNKLNNIENNAEVNIIESVSVNGTPQEITDKNLNIEIETYTDTDKEQVQANTAARHTHSNKALLDTYKQTEANLKKAVDNTHTHANKEILDTYTLTEEELLERTNPVNVSEYSFYIVTTENTTTIPITYEQYNDGDIVDVYINGMKLIKGLHFSISENNIVLVNEVDVVGTEIEIVIKKYN